MSPRLSNMQIVHVEACVIYILDVIMLSLLRVQLESRMKGQLWRNLNLCTQVYDDRGSNHVTLIFP